MSYSGQSYSIPCERGGLTGNPNIDAIQPYMMTSARNINLQENGRGKRGGTSHVDASAHAGTPRIMGLYDYTLLNGTQFILRATGDGKIYKNDTNTIKTGLSSNKAACFTAFDNKIFICNGADAPMSWDGSAGSTTALTNPAADWTGSNQPIQFIKHGRGNSERMWAVLPSGFYASADGNANEFVTGVVYTPISTPDNSGLVGGVEFGDRLILFSKRHSFLVDDADADTANWGYSTAQWEGGAANWRLIVKTPNDVLCMMEDGDIYSITAVQSYGDYKAASIARPAYINKWIKDNIRLAYIEDFHAVYNPKLRAVEWFMVRNGQTEIDTCLVYYIDRPPEEAWVVHDNTSYASGYSASCSAVVRVGAGNYQVYTGDYDGRVWKMDQPTKHDNSNAFYAGFKTPGAPMDNARGYKHFKRGWIITTPKGAYNLYVYPYIDGVQKTQQSISLAGTGAVLGNFTLGTDVLGGLELLDKPFDVGYFGKRASVEIYNSTAGQDFFISSLQFDFKALGARPS